MGIGTLQNKTVITVICNENKAIDPIIESIIRSLRAHDDASYDKLNEWQRQVKSAGANKQKPARPEDAAILVPPADMTNPALIQLLMNAEKEGNRFLYTTLPEVDLLDQCSGGHKKVTSLIRLGYDLSHYGAQRATADGVSGNPTLRWNFNFSCVEQMCSVCGQWMQMDQFNR